MDAYPDRLFRQMQTTFPDAQVTDWEELVPILRLPDPNDRHVVAAAWAGRADVIVTDNIPDFPPETLPPKLARQSLDDFLLDQIDLHPRQVVTAVNAVASRTGRHGPRMSATDIAVYLQGHGALAFANFLLAELRKPDLGAPEELAHAT
jgi:hypothetical protein